MEVEKDLSMVPAALNTNPGTEYWKENRKWRGIPGVERSKNGRLWVTFYSGGDTEGPDNYVAVIKSEDDGNTWSNPILVLDPPGKVRAYDPCLWHDPQGRLWLFWTQSYEFFDGRAGVWASTCLNPVDETPLWSEPVRIANGVMMNKPTVLSSGEWLLPCAVWGYRNPDGTQVSSVHNYLPLEMYSNVIRTTDGGISFERVGSADVPDRAFDEHMLVERKDGSLWMLVRTFSGIGESVSTDRGKTWSPGKANVLAGPCSRFFVRRLRSGNLLLVNHHQFSGRNNLTAMLSGDEGETWKGFLLLDERGNVSYPDGVEADDGLIYIVYDRERYIDKEICMAVFTEEDVLAGRCVTERARLKVQVKEGPNV